MLLVYLFLNDGVNELICVGMFVDGLGSCVGIGMGFNLLFKFDVSVVLLSKLNVWCWDRCRVSVFYVLFLDVVMKIFFFCVVFNI